MRLWLFYSLVGTGCGYALWRGGREERLCAVIFLVGLIATRLAHGFTANYQEIVWGVLAVDVAMLAVLAAMALYSDRFWPLWITAMQLLGVAGHFVITLQPWVIPWAYRVAITFWSYPMFLTLWLATYRTQLRRTQTGTARFWPNSWLLRLRLIRVRLPTIWFTSSVR